MGANDAKEMLEVAKAECLRLERENRKLCQTIQLGAEQLKASRAHTEMLQREGQAVSLPDQEVRGWLVVDKTTRALDWDGVLHPTEEAARASLDGDRRFNDPDWKPFEIYDILPVLAALSTQPAVGEVTETVWHKDQFYVTIETDAEGLVTISDELLVKLMTESGWVLQPPTQPEPAPELAELFPGTLAALDHLSIRPEVQL